jgi:TrmH family RNA methyltransferase
MPLTSTKHPLLQKVRRAAADGRLTPDGWLVIEGPHLLAEALLGRWELGPVLTTVQGHTRYSPMLAKRNVEWIEVSARAIAAAASTETTQEILALVRPRVSSWREVTAPPALTVVLDGLQDPGNAGTIVRSAEAFGAGGIVFLEGCVRVANGKFLRATAGSIFRLPFLEGITRAELIKQTHVTGMDLYALTAQGKHQGKRSLADADLRGPCALITGSESHGVSPELLAAAIGLAIPTKRVESLNAAVACSIALFEAARQRETR